MTDHFAVLSVPRLPWLDPAPLKDQFLALSAEAHPDRVHSLGENERQIATQKFTALNSAYQCLREPKDRLLHLLELELGTKPQPVQSVATGALDVFVEVGQLCQNLDTFLKNKHNATSPLVKVQFFEQGFGWLEKAKSLQQKILQAQEALTMELKSLNSAWHTAPPVGSSDRAGRLPLDRVEEIYRGFGYSARWSAQLQERMVQLSF